MYSYLINPDCRFGGKDLLTSIKHKGGVAKIYTCRYSRSIRRYSARSIGANGRKRNTFCGVKKILMRFKGMQDGSETTYEASEDNSLSLFLVTVGR